MKNFIGIITIAVTFVGCHPNDRIESKSSGFKEKCVLELKRVGTFTYKNRLLNFANHQYKGGVFLYKGIVASGGKEELDQITNRDIYSNLATNLHKKINLPKQTDLWNHNAPQPHKDNLSAWVSTYKSKMQVLTTMEAKLTGTPAVFVIKAGDAKAIDSKEIASFTKIPMAIPGTRKVDYWLSIPEEKIIGYVMRIADSGNMKVWLPSDPDNPKLVSLAEDFNFGLW